MRSYIIWTSLAVLLLCQKQYYLEAFIPQHQRTRFIVSSHSLTTNKNYHNNQLFIFGRNNNDEKVESIDQNETTDEDNKKSSMFSSFFNREKKEQEEEISDSSSTTSTVTTTKTTTTTTASSSPPKTTTTTKTVVQLTPEEMAKKLRAEAEKARLEAERMDAELTLRKIERLEKELAAATNKKSSSSSSDSKKTDVEQLQRELEALMRKVSGDSNGSSVSTTKMSTSTTKSTTDTSSVTETSSPTQGTTTATTTAVIETGLPKQKPIWPDYIDPVDEKEKEEIRKTVEGLPKFMQASMLAIVEMEFEKDQITDKLTFNSTVLVDRLDLMRRCDFSYSSRPAPQFTQEQINTKIKEIKDSMEKKKREKKNNPFNLFNGGADYSSVDTLLSKMDDDPERYKELLNEEDLTKLAQLVLEYEYYITEPMSTTETDSDNQIFEMMSQEEPMFKAILDNLDDGSTMVDATIETLYPKCLTKSKVENVDEKNIPTQAQVQQLITDILPKVKFQTSAKPEPVLGGYVIRGSSSTKSTNNADEFIRKLDDVMERSSLNDKMTIFYTPDFTPLGQSDFDDNAVDMMETSNILYVTGPEICRESKPIQLSIVTGLGVATTWYLSLYPFLLNPTIATKVDEQLALADANMTPDLSWLTDLSLPLFTTFVGIQLIHELAHLVVAGANGFKTTAPTFVPSIITGITSSVTTFKSPPKNKAAMFDYSISGPLAGMIASLFAITLGAQLTTVTDPSLFPALPLEILRQSTLGGGIIENILGSGSLSVPAGALGTSAVSQMTEKLHPIAIAGYISLVVNALSLLPVGTTDGGRVALAVFGRVAKPVWGSVFLFALLFIGLTGSDLFLFYFAFVTAFQTGNEIPARQEVDQLDIPRVFLAIATYLVAALALIPFQ